MELKIPPLLLTLIVAGLMWLVAQYLPNLSVSLAFKYIVSFNFLGVGLMFLGSAVKSFRAEDTTLNPVRPGTSSALVTSEIYQVTRNPMYLGLLCILIAFGGFLSNIFVLPLIIGFVLYMNRFQIVPEERALEAKFGEDFVLYKKKVNRWL